MSEYIFNRVGTGRAATITINGATIDLKRWVERVNQERGVTCSFQQVSRRLGRGLPLEDVLHPGSLLQRRVDALAQDALKQGYICKEIAVRIGYTASNWNTLVERNLPDFTAVKIYQPNPSIYLIVNTNYQQNWNDAQRYAKHLMSKRADAQSAIQSGKSKPKRGTHDHGFTLPRNSRDPGLAWLYS